MGCCWLVAAGEFLLLQLLAPCWCLRLGLLVMCSRVLMFLSPSSSGELWIGESGVLLLAPCGSFAFVLMHEVVTSLVHAMTVLCVCLLVLDLLVL